MIAIMSEISHQHGKTQHGYKAIEKSDWEDFGPGGTKNKQGTLWSKLEVNCYISGEGTTRRDTTKQSQIILPWTIPPGESY